MTKEIISEPGQCPVCGSDDLCSSDLELFLFPEFSIEHTCNNCGCSFEEHYLAEYIVTEVSTNDKLPMKTPVLSNLFPEDMN